MITTINFGFFRLSQGHPKIWTENTTPNLILLNHILLGVGGLIEDPHEYPLAE